VTRKDYELIARAIREANIPKKEKKKVVNKLADHLQAENIRFERTTFLIACEAWER
jgi:hypothetical protein